MSSSSQWAAIELACNCRCSARRWLAAIIYGSRAPRVIPYTPTDGLEVGNPEDYEDGKMIFESPDGGETVYSRKFNQYEKRTKIKDPRDISKDE